MDALALSLVEGGEFLFRVCLSMASPLTMCLQILEFTNQSCIPEWF